MSCDIHAMFERKSDEYWINSGDPNMSRNYTIFAILGNVRNYDNIPYISENRFDLNDDLCDLDICVEFRNSLEQWNGDAHSASYTTLTELKQYDVDNKCVHKWPYAGYELQNLIRYGENIKTFHKLDNDDDVRLAFFFDN